MQASLSRAPLCSEKHSFWGSKSISRNLFHEKSCTWKANTSIWSLLHCRGMAINKDARDSFLRSALSGHHHSICRWCRSSSGLHALTWRRLRESACRVRWWHRRRTCRTPARSDEDWDSITIQLNMRLNVTFRGYGPDGRSVWDSGSRRRRLRYLKKRAHHGGRHLSEKFDPDVIRRIARCVVTRIHSRVGQSAEGSPFLGPFDST